MSLRGRFVLYLVLLHAVFAAGAVLALAERPLWLLAVEGLFLVSLIVGVGLLRSLLEPVRMLRSAVELIAANEFGTRFRETGRPELDALIRVYNRMADQLRSARIHSEEQEHFLQRIIEATPTGVLTLDLEGRIAQLNPSAEALLGRRREEVLGQRLAETGGPFADSLASLAEGEARIVPLRGRRRVKCQALHFLDRGFARRFLLLDELTEELHRTEKAAYEKLIRMLSHEVGNTAGAVGSLLTSCLRYREQLEPDSRDDFAQALGLAIGRTGRLNRFMQEFAEVVRLPAPSRRPCDLRGLLEDTVFLLREQASDRGIEWRWEIEAELPPIALDPAQMEQVFLNVLKNALEAVGERGTIKLRLGLDRDRPFAAILDNGGGIPDEVRPHLFTPFFTSKRHGQGIGLTMVQEILVAHGCEFSLESTGDGWTEFRIRF